MELTDEIRSKALEYAEAMIANDTARCEALEREYDELDEKSQEMVAAFLAEYLAGKSSTGSDETDEPMLGKFKNRAPIFSHCSRIG